MPRSGSGVYSKPAGTTAVPNTTITSSQFNTTVDDIASDLNYPRPIASGGTGAANVADARDNLGLTIGTDVQAYDALLQAIAGLTTSANKVIMTTGTDTVALKSIGASGDALPLLNVANTWSQNQTFSDDITINDADNAAIFFTDGSNVIKGSVYVASDRAFRVNVRNTSGVVTGSMTLDQSGNLALSGTLGVGSGGTGASTASAARSNLGLGSLAVANTINNSNWSGTPLSVANGGTGASDASTARSNLGANNAANLTAGYIPLARVPHITGSEGGTPGIARLNNDPTNDENLGSLRLYSDGTLGYVFNGSAKFTVSTSGVMGTVSIPSSLITGLGSLASSNTINNTNWSGTALSIANGGTGASDAATARSNLGLGSLATMDVSDLFYTGSSSSNTSFPIGSYLVIAASNAYGPRNSTTSVYLYSADNAAYTYSSVGNTAVGGVWRYRSKISSAASQVQRTA